MWTGCALGVALRLLLYAAGATGYLEEHLELSSPPTSHTRLKECLFLLDAGISPYAGDTCHHPPLLLQLLLPLHRGTSELAHFVFLSLVDLATALLLRQLAVQYAALRAKAGQPWAEASVRLSPPDEKEAASGVAVVPKAAASAAAAPGLEDMVSPAFVGLSYLLNPITVASCLARSAQNVQHLWLCAAFAAAGAGRGGLAAAALAVALYVCPFTPVVLLLPIAYLAFAQRAPDDGGPNHGYERSNAGTVLELPFVWYLLRFGAALLLLLGCLVGASLAATHGEPHFLSACFASVILVRDLTPNVGIFWYIFIEVFERYRSLFLLVFQAHLLFYPLPLHLRVGRHRPIGPWLHCAVATGVVSVFKPYPTASDHGLMLSVLLIPVEILRESEKQFAFLMSGLLFGLSMFPTMSAVWLTRNAGNANFLYNMTLVINVFGCLLLTEWVRAGMKLRRRQHLAAFCRQVVLSTLDAVLEGKGARGGPGGPGGSAERPAGPPAVQEAEQPAPAAANGAEGLRRRH